MSVRNTVKSIQDIMRQDVGVDGYGVPLCQDSFGASFC